MTYNVVIVEDDPMVLFINQSYLNKINNFKLIGSADNEQAALDLLSQKKVDLILIDAHLIQGNGFNLVKLIRKKGFTTDIIMITAEKNSNFIEEMFRYGVVDYILKPFNFHRFERSLATFQARKNILHSSSQLTPKELDGLNSYLSAIPEENLTLEKGLTQPTLNLIKKTIYNIKAPFTINDLNNELDLSHVSIRKYIKHLEDTGFLISELEYQTAGRPVSFYYPKEKN
ncbi:response regulator [Vagococcus sp. PNs007]|uniref:Transcriptional regulatory protein n=1 Tax=Vagococcus proximus TaxID=2991417 RepID=A0ABT5X1H5_9ENTE|nr:response regulator [Vagococcus proximus]MDF0479845.1 response regulator [Vagococcus proximus]